jgi:hypothetical protein
MIIIIISGIIYFLEVPYADFLPHFWHRSGTDVAISWRLKMSSKVLPKNRVMCLQIFRVGFGEAASPSLRWN